MFKIYIQKRLEHYVKRYFKKHPTVKLVVVTGSVGKTSTKRALGMVLSQQFRVRMDNNNHNTEMSAPLGILGIEYPKKVHSIAAWRTVLKAAKLRVQGPTDVDVIVQELGTDHPGDIGVFGRYLKPDYAVVSAVTAEHMEFFKTMDAVAKEELSVSKFSQYTFINTDDVSSKYAELETNPNFTTYGVSEMAEYRMEISSFDVESGYSCKVYGPAFNEPFNVETHVLGEHSLRPVMAAIAVSGALGALPHYIQSGVRNIQPVPGRMSLLKGLDGTWIIDDTYNSSPAAALSALRTLYDVFADAPQRIAVLGDMRELGATSQFEHEALGANCNGERLAWVVTVGPDTEKYLAPIARQHGCQVKSFKNPIEAAEFVRTITEEGAAILVKGSQNTIYLEEAVKNLCLMSEHSKLVRQSPEWMQIKKQFIADLQK